ncbi:hypothetical protein CH252_04935 [Rhodococcus sp. 06-1477-1B]|nr:hypothetical protein CH252_04935 [Rhodococcus sp. 06-1477-1B]
MFLEDSTITQRQVRQLLKELHKRWEVKVQANGFRSTLKGSDLRVVRQTMDDLSTLGSYVTKGVSVNTDVAGLGSSFWDALRDSLKGDARATQWWRNFEGAVRNRKGMFRISYSLMRSYAVEQAREARAALWKDTTTEPEPVAFFDPTDWFNATKDFPELREQLLLVAEAEGVEACRQFLTDNGIRWFAQDDNRELRTDAWSQLQAAKSRRVA